MMPIDPLYIERLLIEKTNSIIEKKLNRVIKENKIHIRFIESFIEFIRTYEDRYHPCKKEDIFFHDLF